MARAIGLSDVPVTTVGPSLGPALAASPTWGSDATNILLFSIDPNLNGYTRAQTGDLCDELQRRIGTLPGVLSATT